MPTQGLLHGEDIAVKVLSENSYQGAEEFKKEVQIIGEMIRHRSFVPLKGYCTEENCIVYEYMPNGSVKDLISGTYVYSSNIICSNSLHIYNIIYHELQHYNRVILK